MSVVLLLSTTFHYTVFCFHYFPRVVLPFYPTLFIPFPPRLRSQHKLFSQVIFMFFPLTLSLPYPFTVFFFPLCSKVLFLSNYSFRFFLLFFFLRESAVVNYFFVFYSVLLDQFLFLFTGLSFFPGTFAFVGRRSQRTMLLRIHYSSRDSFRASFSFLFFA